MFSFDVRDVNKYPVVLFNVFLIIFMKVNFPETDTSPAKGVDNEFFTCRMTQFEQSDYSANFINIMIE